VLVAGTSVFKGGAAAYRGNIDHAHDISFPLIVKPTSEDGSIGIDAAAVVTSVKELMERAEQAEAKEAKETLDIPAELARREKRVEALKQARQVIEQRAKEMAAAQQEEYTAKQAKRHAQREAGQKPRGAGPTPPRGTPDPKAQYNFTDPESRIMKAGNGQHFEQSYNAQAAVDERMLIVGERVSVAPNDKCELPATVAAFGAPTDVTLANPDDFRTAAAGWIHGRRIRR